VDDTPRVAVAGREVAVAYTYRLAGPDLIVMVHGLGCTRESFRTAFTSPALAGYSLCAIDLPGHGASDTLGRLSTIAHLADAVAAVAHRFAGLRLHLVGHSLGGAVTVAAAPQLRVVSLVSIEGNLLPADCGLISRATAAQPLHSYLQSGFDTFVAGLRTSPDRASRVWAGWLARCDPVAIHTAARSLVDTCDHGQLPNLLADMAHTAYVHGVHSDVSHILPLFDPASVYEIAGTGHFPMIDNPASLWHTLATTTQAASRPPAGNEPAPGEAASIITAAARTTRGDVRRHQRIPAGGTGMPSRKRHGPVGDG